MQNFLAYVKIVGKWGEIMAFQDKLKELMTEKNMKAVDLARATGLSEAAVSDYLKGKKEPRGKQSISIAKALGVSLDTLWETGFQDDSNYAEFGRKLKSIRKEKSLSQVELATDEDRPTKYANEIMDIINGLSDKKQQRLLRLIKLFIEEETK